MKAELIEVYAARVILFL